MRRLDAVEEKMASGMACKSVAAWAEKEWSVSIRQAQNYLKTVRDRWAQIKDPGREIRRREAINRQKYNLEKLAQIRDEQTLLVTVVNTSDGPIPVYKDHRINAIDKMIRVEQFLSQLEGTSLPVDDDGAPLPQVVIYLPDNKRKTAN